MKIGFTEIMKGEFIMIDQGVADYFISNRIGSACEAVTLGQELSRIFRGLHMRPMKHARQADFAWSYEELGNGIPDDIPD